MQKIDANIVLRYILDDHETLSPKARKIIDTQIVEVPVEVLCEVIYVLNGHYEEIRHFSRIIVEELGFFKIPFARKKFIFMRRTETKAKSTKTPLPLT